MKEEIDFSINDSLNKTAFIGGKSVSTFEKSFTYEVPTSFKKEKLKLVGIVVKNDNKVLNVRLSEIGKNQVFEEL